MDQNNTVYPTYTCFDDAMQLIDYVASEYKQDDVSMLSLVHGIVQGDDGENFVHAWVEDSSTGVAIFAGMQRGEKIYFYTPIDAFYTGHRVKETTKYTIAEALQENLRTVHFGPWLPKYVAMGEGKDHKVRMSIGTAEMRLGTIGKLPRKEVVK